MIAPQQCSWGVLRMCLNSQNFFTTVKMKPVHAATVENMVQCFNCLLPKQIGDNKNRFEIAVGRFLLLVADCVLQL
jgi:hypothetical protein